MRKYIGSTVCIVLFGFLTCMLQGRAAAISTVSLTANRTALLADGKHTADLAAAVRDNNARPVANAQVIFSTSAGQLSQTQAYTDFSGTARVRLTSASLPGTASIMATTPGGTASTLTVEFTNDPEATYNGNNYMTFAAKTYLAYSATDRVIEGEGTNGGARLTFRNFEVVADRMQYRCDDGILRAHGNVFMKRGSHKLLASRLYYSLASGDGWAVTREENGTSKSVRIAGENLLLTESPTPPPFSYMSIPDLQVKLIIAAVGITYFPNEKLQFRRPKFYQDQVQIMKLAYYELPLHSEQLFSDQFISVGTSGLGLELPYYYKLTADQSGEIIIRHQQQIGRGYYSTEPGWGIDLIQTYTQSGDKRYEGAYGFTGLTRNDWDFRWNHSQEFNSNTQSAFDLEFPGHDSVYGSTNLTQQFKLFRWGANVAAGRTFLSDDTISTNANLYLETQPKGIMGNKNYQYTVGTTFISAHSQSNDTNIPDASETREGLNVHAFSRPINLDKQTTFTESMTIGQTWAGHEGSGLTSLATLAVDRHFKTAGSLNLTYDLVYQPSTFIDTGGKHRFSASYSVNKTKSLTFTVFGSMYADSPDSSMLADMSYRINNQWRIISAATLERYNSISYNDYEMTLGRRFGARELQLTYSTYLKRVSLDFTATRF